MYLHFISRDISWADINLNVLLAAVPILSDKIISNYVAAHESKRRILEEEIRQGASSKATRGGEVQKRGKHIQ